jgi:hypothetical protein
MSGSAGPGNSQTLKDESMYLREIEPLTVTQLKDKLDVGGETVVVSPGNLKLNSTTGEIEILPEGANRRSARRIPLGADSVEAVANFVQVPKAFHKRLPGDLRDTLINELFARQHDQALVRVTDTEILYVRDPRSKVIEPRRFVDVAARVLSPEAQVIDFTNTPDFFGFDVVASPEMKRGQGGDRKVGDITRGGVRFGQDTKQELAPWVQRYMYRLVCTNGMEIPDTTLKIDARGDTIDEVIAALEQMAELAFSKVEEDLVHFYALRDQVVDQPERMMNRLARERNLSDRMRLQLVDAVPQIVQPNTPVTMFDLVNLATNQANNPEHRQAGIRRQLERFGGDVTAHLSQRCTVCASALN